MFAAHAYVDRRGVPRSLEDFRNHDVIGYDRGDQIIKGFRTAGLDVDRRFFSFRCDNQVVCWRMVLAGFGIGFNHVQVGEAEPRVMRLFAETVMPTLPTWLTAHSELKTSRRIRRVFDFLADQLQRVQSGVS